MALHSLKLLFAFFPLIIPLFNGCMEQPPLETHEISATINLEAEELLEATASGEEGTSLNTLIPQILKHKNPEIVQMLSTLRNRQLHNAEKKSAHNKISEALLREDVTFTDDKGETPLHWAVSNNDHIAVILLIMKDALINAKNMHGWTPLHIAALHNHIKIARLLLENDADIHATNDFERSPLHLAARNGHEATTKLLIEKAAKTGLADKTGMTPLHYAAANGHTIVVALLLGNGIARNVSDNNGQTPLHTAAASGHEGVVRLLLNENFL